MPQDRKEPSVLAHPRRFQLLVDGIFDYAVYLLDAVGRIASWNSGAQRIYRYSSDEALGQHFSQLFVLDDRQSGLPQDVLATAARAGRHECEGWRVRKDGSRFWALTLVDAVRNESGEVIGYMKVTRDMTERRAEQQALVDSERRFRLLMEAASDYALFMLDANGLVTEWNAGAERLYGYTAAEAVGHHFSLFCTIEDRTSGAPSGALEVAVRQGRYQGEVWRARRDGGRFRASILIEAIRNDSCELLGFAYATRDVTERRQAHEALRETERQFRLLVNGVTDYALYMLDESGVIVSWNPGAEKIKGYTADEIIGHHFSRFYAEADRLAGVPEKALEAAARDGKFESEGWRVRKDGSFFWAHSVLNALRDNRGLLVGFAKITRDMTERREAQKALEEAQKHLAHSQKMEALGQLTGGAAHDFNNLLMIVSGQTRLLKKTLAEQPQALQALEAIEYAIQRGASLTRQMLSFSKRQRLYPEMVDLTERLASFGKLLLSSIKNNVELLIAVDADVWPVRMDIGEFELAIVNLVLNANDALGDGGAIKISARNLCLDGGHGPRHLSGDFVVVSIADNGVGIADDVLPKVFEPFFTTKGPDKGTGLGLSQAYGFAQQSGGALEIQSELGKGTTVTLYLPRAATNAPLQDEPLASLESAPAGFALIVEDNPEAADAAASMIEQLGYKSRIANSAEAALGMLAEEDKVDVVLSDIVMPGPLDGMALAKTMREHYPNVPILLTTGYSKAAESAPEEFVIVRKPYDVSGLGRALTQVRAKAPRVESNVVIFPGSRSPQMR